MKFAHPSVRRLSWRLVARLAANLSTVIFLFAPRGLFAAADLPLLNEAKLHVFVVPPFSMEGCFVAPATAGKIWQIIEEAHTQSPGGVAGCGAGDRLEIKVSDGGAPKEFWAELICPKLEGRGDLAPQQFRLSFDQACDLWRALRTEFPNLKGPFDFPGSTGPRCSEGAEPVVRADARP